MTAVHHSPGPWAEADQISIVDSFGEKVAVVYQGSERNLVANRQLVVVAPAMLDLLKRGVRGDNIGAEARDLIGEVERPGGRMGGGQ